MAWIRRQESIAPDNPWFVYWAPGAMHAPHHAPKEFIDRFREQFDMGWDKHRDAVFANQLKLGIIPADAKLSARPEGIPAWDALSDGERKLFARQMEVFAGFLSHLDEHLGRVIDAATLGPNGQNTLVVLSLGDNGCSAEGGLHGTINNMAAQNGFPDDVATMLSHIDELGGPRHENHFSVGWAWSIDCPFQWTKQVASHFGGTRTGLIMHWPAKIAAGGVRSQFHHVIDIAPTIYEAVGITMPDSINGVAQVPLAGVSMAYTYGDAAAARRHTTQYFEIMGNRAIYHNGWIASARHGVPWVLLARRATSRTINGSYTTSLPTSARRTTSRTSILASSPSCRRCSRRKQPNMTSSRLTIVLPSAARSPIGQPSRRDARPSRCTLARSACPRAARRTSR
jgi:arylsulfatase A-like enzyme